MAVLMPWLTNMDLGDGSVMYLFLKSYIKLEFVVTMFNKTPHAARMPMSDSPTHYPMAKIDSFPKEESD